VYPSGLLSPRGALFNFDWITLVVIILLLLIGGIYFVLARPDKRLATPGRPAVAESTGSPAADR
jgi:hypothetical protein